MNIRNFFIRICLRLLSMGSDGISTFICSMAMASRKWILFCHLTSRRRRKRTGFSGLFVRFIHNKPDISLQEFALCLIEIKSSSVPYLKGESC